MELTWGWLSNAVLMEPKGSCEIRECFAVSAWCQVGNSYVLKAWNTIIFVFLGPLITDWRKYVQGYLPTRSGNGHLREHQTPMNLKCYRAILKLLGLPAEEYIDVCAYTVYIHTHVCML
jgi:hypothetical protein